MNVGPIQSWIDIYTQDPSRAWQTFLERHDSLVRHVIHRLVEDYDERMELYTHTLDKLKESDSRKLVAYFDKKRDYSFETWIAVVVRNCCMDWFRKEKGRTRLLDCIKELSELDQLIFKYIYLQGYSQSAAFEILTVMNQHQVSMQELCSRIGQINQILHKKTRWRLEREWRQILSSISLGSATDTDYDNSPKNIFTQNNPNPEEQLLLNLTSKILQNILTGMPAEYRIIIHLHFYKNLSLKEIARVLRMKNIWQVHRRLKKALEFLKKKLKEKDIDLSDLE